MKHSRVRLNVTSFGPFLHVKENPSALIAERMIQLHDSDASPSSSFVVASYRQLSVTMESVDAFFADEQQTKQIHSEETEKENNADSEQHVFEELYVHFGVDTSATAIHIELCAANEANFDHDGDPAGRHLHHPINPNNFPEAAEEHGKEVKNESKNEKERKATDHQHRTKLEAAVKDVLNAACGSGGNGFFKLFGLSEDAGRYLCNYVFYRSMDETARNPRVASLFIHVPAPPSALSASPFSVAGQAEAIRWFLEELCSKIVCK